MKDYKFKFSVIIPVYNVEDYLEETIESITTQSIGFEKNIQLILVNDGSPDNSGEICEKYQQLYPNNVKYIIKENGGVSSARNAGIEHIEGKYVNFLDSDDKWGEETFANIYAFFEEHYDEIDVVCARMRFFEAKKGWHPLDYKFWKGTRVADLLDEDESDSIHLHVSSTVIKYEALGENDRFRENVKYGEDGFFLNTIVLRKAKLGIMCNAIFFYRKRRNLSSATQVQKVDLNYYTVSPQIYYNGLIDLSMQYYGRVIEYVQNIIAYDWGWRVSDVLPEDVCNDEQLYLEYMTFLKEKLQLVDEKIILGSKVHRSFNVKSTLLKLRNNTDLVTETVYDKNEKTILYKDNVIVNLNSNHGLCQINICEIKNDKLVVEGLIAKWLLETCPEEKIEFVLRIGKHNYKPELKDFKFIEEKNIFGSKTRNYYFKKEFNLKKILRGRQEIKINTALLVNGKPSNITFKYGKFVPNTTKFRVSYRVFGKYFMVCNKKNIRIWIPRSPKTEHLKYEVRAQRWLLKKHLFRYAWLRIQFFILRLGKFKDKKLWIISDRYNKAGDNGEAFFKYMCSGAVKDKSIYPVFAISKYSSDAERLKGIGDVIFFEDKLYPLYFLCADKHINSSGVDFACNALKGNMRTYLNDLKRGDNVFLQHGIIYNDLSSWLQKFNKNISLFITSAQREYESISGGSYLYSEDEVALTGLARYDFLENKSEKKIAIIPTWRASIKESYNAMSQSVYFEGFKETEYFKFYNGLINDERLLDIMRKKGYKGIFCLHPMHEQQSIDFEGNDVFAINEGRVDYTNIFSTASLLVTDYSSIFFDFAYLNKPLVFTQFDKETFFEGQIYNAGYFDHEKDGFGPVCYDLETTVNSIVDLIEKDCTNDEKYLKRIEEFYAFHDRNNCERIYTAIKNL